MPTAPDNHDAHDTPSASASGCLDVYSSQSPATIDQQHLASDEAAVSNGLRGTETDVFIRLAPGFQGSQLHRL